MRPLKVTNSKTINENQNASKNFSNMNLSAQFLGVEESKRINQVVDNIENNQSPSISSRMEASGKKSKNDNYIMDIFTGEMINLRAESKILPTQ